LAQVGQRLHSITCLQVALSPLTMSALSDKDLQPSAPLETPEFFEWAQFARNTFVDVPPPLPPGLLELCRAATEPANARAPFSAVDELPPPPPSLEFYQSEDPFEYPQYLASGLTQGFTAVPLVGTPGEKLRAPPAPLELENFASDEVSKSFLNATKFFDQQVSQTQHEDEELPPPALLELETLKTDDPFDSYPHPEHHQESGQVEVPKALEQDMLDDESESVASPDWNTMSKNTFIDFQLPQQSPVYRPGTAPARSRKLIEIPENVPHNESDDAGPCPPPLQLESLETYDPFESQHVFDPSVIAHMSQSRSEQTKEAPGSPVSSTSTEAGPPGLCKLAALALDGTDSNTSGDEDDDQVLPPPPLPLESCETYDPFEHFQQPEFNADHGLNEPENSWRTSSENAAANDAEEIVTAHGEAVTLPEWNVFSKNTFLDFLPLEPPPLDLFRAASEPIGTVSSHQEPEPPTWSSEVGKGLDDSAAFTAALSTSEADEGMAPPPLELETLQTEDIFNKPEMPAFEPAKVDVVELEPAIATRLHGPPPPPSTPMPVFPTPPPPPPSMPAPVMEAPCSPEAPLAPAYSGPKEDKSRPSVEELACQGMMICTPSEKGLTHVHWAIDARKLDSQHKQFVSSGFSIDIPGQGPQTFKMLIYPKIVNAGKHGAGFRKAKGVGRVMIKCEAQLEEKRSDLVFRIGVGRDSKLQLPRGPVTWDAYEQSCSGLPKAKEDWDFAASVDDSNTFLVSLQIAPLSAVIANPHIWFPAANDTP